MTKKVILKNKILFCFFIITSLTITLTMSMLSDCERPTKRRRQALSEKDILLFKAITENDIGATSFLVKNNANINAQNKKFDTPLHIAIDTENLEISKLLIDNKKINTNSQNSNGDAPLHKAVKNNALQIVMLLLKHREIKINEKNGDGSTALHMATFYNYLEIVKILLDQKNIEISSKNNNGNTPLHIAIYKNNPKIAQMLIFHGARINATNNKNKTPVHSALDRPNLEASKLLLRHVIEIPEIREVSLDAPKIISSEVGTQISIMPELRSGLGTCFIDELTENPLPSGQRNLPLPDWGPTPVISTSL